MPAPRPLPRRHLGRLAALATLALLSAACSGSTEGGAATTAPDGSLADVSTSSSSGATSSTSVSTSTSGSSTSTTTDTPPTTTGTSTSVSTTTTLVVTTTGPTTTGPSTPGPTTTAGGSATTTTAPAPPAPVPAPATAFVTTDDEQLREIDVATGSTVRVVADPFAGDGVFRGVIRLASDRSTIWFSEGYEDGWFDCGSSLGSIGRIDPGTGAIEVIAQGYGVEPSADGARIAYVSSTVCVPDPDNEEFWVLTPGDRVIVRELAAGTERAFVTDVAPDSYGSPSSVEGAWFGPRGDLYVLTGDGVLRNVDTAGSTVIQDHPVVASDVIGVPVAATATDLITQDFGDEGSTDVYAVDLASGAARLLGSSEEYATVGVSPGGHVLVAADVEVTVAPGAELTLIVADDGAFDDDAFVLDVDW